MARYHLRLTGDNYRQINTQPFADWLATVDRRIERRTGIRLLTNERPNAYWLNLYHMGESSWQAADDFVEDWRC